MQLREDIIFDNRYRLIRLLGSGGFSEVWLAEDTKVSNQRKALKVYAPGKGLDADGVQLFSKEYELVYDLNHSHLLRPSHFDVCDRSPYLVLPYCEQGSAAKLVGKISEEEAWRFLYDVASGLAYLHDQEPPIIHQDIKPDNILIDHRGNYLITDFGISAKARSTLRKSMGNVKSGGTIAYMAPERFGKDNTPIKASDIWSVGATVFELLDGDTPFSEHGGLIQKGGADIPDITGAWSNELREIVTRCLNKDPWDRPTANQIVEWSEKNFRGEKIVLEPEPQPQPPKPVPDLKPSPHPRFKKWAVLYIACIAVIISVIFYIALKHYGDKPSPYTEAVISPEETDWEKAVGENTLQAYRQYESQYPSGKHVDKAKQQIQAFEDEQAWTVATEKNTLEGYRAYLADRPKGRYAVTAKNLITGLERQQAEQDEINRQKQAGGSTATTPQSATTPPSTPARQPAQQAEQEEINRQKQAGGNTATTPQSATTPPSTPARQPAQQTETKRETGGTTSFVEPEMVLVRGGTFTMGCTPEQGNDCGYNEKPAHQVTVSDFYIGKYEVTQAQWQAIMGNNPSYFKGDNLPVERVSWKDVQEFIDKLNTRTGKKYRLPTEAEWEYAARGGNSSRGYKYSGSKNPSDVGWYQDNSGGKTHPVGTKSPNELGLYDMSGNVWEWCSDWYGDSYYNSNAQTDPQGPSSGSERVFRGGCWYYKVGDVRTSFRYSYAPGSRINYLGFRLARGSK